VEPKTRKLLSAEALTQAVKLIRGAGRIEIDGIGSSGPIAVDLAYRLLQWASRRGRSIPISRRR